MTAPQTTGTEPSPWEPNLATFGARLALVRQRMGWGNVAEAARECGLERESWRLWEQTNREPRRLVTICMAIAGRTGIDIDWLVYGPGGKPAIRPTQAGEELTRWYGRDPLAARTVRHGDARRKPHGARPSSRTDRNHPPTSHTERTVSLPATA